jgi:DNA polymerase-3 subunit epsilon
LHGALLDAELLADVYINLTRGQEALLIDAGGDDGKAGSEESVDLSNYVLPVIQANAQEQAAHQEQLAQLDKASGGKTLWRQLGSAQSAAA